MRIYRIVLDPGQSTGKHTHQRSGLSVAVSGGKVSFELEAKKTEIINFKPGDFRWNSGPPYSLLAQHRHNSLRSIRHRMEVATQGWICIHGRTAIQEFRH